MQLIDHPQARLSALCSCCSGILRGGWDVRCCCMYGGWAFLFPKRIPDRLPASTLASVDPPIVPLDTCRCLLLSPLSAPAGHSKCACHSSPARNPDPCLAEAANSRCRRRPRRRRWRRRRSGGRSRGGWRGRRGRAGCRWRGCSGGRGGRCASCHTRQRGAGSRPPGKHMQSAEQIWLVADSVAVVPAGLQALL